MASRRRRTRESDNSKNIKLIIGIILIIISIWTGKEVFPDEINHSPNEDLKNYQVVRVVDGDTLVINIDGNQEKVRLIGINTPESVSPQEYRNTKEGKEASNFAKETLEGKIVAVEYDVEPRDKYGRTLAYIYVDGKMFNETLLEKGYARTARSGKNTKYKDKFKSIEEKASANKVGFWVLDESPWR